MPSVDLFEARDEAEIRALLNSAKNRERPAAYRDLFALGVDYMEGRQVDDVEGELSARYERTQTGDRGGQIAPQTIPLTSRYVEEAATAYARPVTRKLTKPDGNVDEANTDALHDMLADVGYDETMLRLEQYVVLLKTAGLWFQARGGELRAQVVWPQLIWPVLPDDDWASVSEQDDYAGYVVELYASDHDAKSHNRYAWLEPAQAAFYSGVDPYTVDSGGMTRFDNGLRWPQTVDGEGIAGTEQELPLQPFVIANDRLPVGELIIDTDPSIALANRELNLQLAILLDTLAHQGWATMLVNLLNPDSPPSTFSAGPRNGLALGAGESASMLSSPVNYTDLVGTLETWVRMLAMSMSQSPNDFSAQATAAASGFAKLVDSLPKIEARRRRLERWRRFERQYAWPRIAAIGDALGLLAGGIGHLSTLTLHTEYQPLEFPESVDERVARETHELAHGLTSPAKILAKRSGQSVDEAAEEIAENLGQGEEAEPIEGAAPGADEIQKTALNGAQVTAMQGIVTSVAMGELPRSSAVAMIEVAFQLSPAEAERIVGDAGKVSVSTAASQKPPASPVTAPPPEPPAPPKPPTPGEAIGQLIKGRK